MSASTTYLIPTQPAGIGFKDETTQSTCKPIEGSVASDCLVRMARQGLFLTFNFLFRDLFLLSLKLFNLWFGVRFFQYIFLVYPGDKDDLKAYCPRWLSWMFRNGHFGIAGIITTGSTKKGRGLVVVIPEDDGELAGDQQRLCKIVEKLDCLRQNIGCASLALAGRLPSLLSDTLSRRVPARALSIRGTVYSIQKAVMSLYLPSSSVNVAIIGVGLIGKVLADSLQSLGYTVYGVDRKRRTGKCRFVRSLTELKKAHVVVVLTPKGDDLKEYRDYLDLNCFIVDDTHPEIPSSLVQDFSTVRVGIELPGVRFYPKLPGIPANIIPGCAVGALTVCANGGSLPPDQVSFDNIANDVGFVLP